MALALFFHLNKLRRKTPQDSKLTHHCLVFFCFSFLTKRANQNILRLKGLICGSSTDLWAGESNGAIEALLTLKEERQKKQVRLCLNFPLLSSLAGDPWHRLVSQALSKPRADQ